MCSRYPRATGLPARLDSAPGAGNTLTGCRGCGRSCFSAIWLMRSLAAFSSSVNSMVPDPKAGRLKPLELDTVVDAIALPKAGRLPKPLGMDVL